MSKRYYNTKHTDQSTEEVKVEEVAIEDILEETKTEEPVKPINPEPAQTTNKKIKTVKAKSLLVREKADRNSKIKHVLVSGEKVTVLETDNDWYKVEVQGGKVRGYCMSAYIE